MCNKAVVILEDDTLDAEHVVKEIKKNKTFKIIKTHTVKEAISTIVKFNYDISLMVINLTNKKRLAVIKILAKRKTKFPIVVLTKDPNDDYIVNRIDDHRFCLANITQLDQKDNVLMKISIIETYMDDCEILTK